MTIIPGKQKNKSVLATLVLLLLMPVFVFNAKEVRAQYDSYDDEVSELLVDKTIKGLSEGEWVDNYSSDEMIFGPEDIFDYKIVVKNDGNRNQTWIKVTDTLPSYLNIVFGYDPDEEDTFDSNTRKLVYEIAEIKPGEENSRVIRVQLKDKDQIPVEVTRITNRVHAKAESGAEDSDDAVAYIGNGEKVAEKTPDTGINGFVIAAMVIVLAIAGAITLRKIGKGELLKK